MSAETAPAQVPQPRFRPTGTWGRVIEDHGHTSGADSLARLVLGSADDLAQARMLITRQVRESTQLALDGGRAPARRRAEGGRLVRVWSRGRRPARTEDAER